MELSCYLKRVSAKVSVVWAPRSGTYDADALAHGNTSSFNPSRRILLKVDCTYWDVLLTALDMGPKLESRHETSTRTCPKSTTPNTRRTSADCRCMVGAHMSVCCAGLPPSCDGKVQQWTSFLTLWGVIVSHGCGWKERVRARRNSWHVCVSRHEFSPVIRHCRRWQHERVLCKVREGSGR